MKKNASQQLKVSRRYFLGTMGAALAMPMIVPSSVFGADGAVAPSNRLVIGIAGWGWIGPDNTREFLNYDKCQVVAACDLSDANLTKAVNTINQKYGNQDCKKYHDYKEMIAQPGIDAVMLALPDHMHAMAAVHAANAKKDIYGEKPLAKTIAEAQAIVKAVKDNGRIFQVGSWQRSDGSFHKAAEIVRNGLIGKIKTVEVGLPGGGTDAANTVRPLVARLAAMDPPIRISNDLRSVIAGTDTYKACVTEPPPGFDYDAWTGPSEKLPYIAARVERNWRWNYNTGGGQLMDWCGHHVDIAHWGMGMDDSGPSEIEGTGVLPNPDGIWNTIMNYRIELKYPNDMTMTISSSFPGGTKWIGTDGWVSVDRGRFDCSNPEWKNYRELPAEMVKIPLEKVTNHRRNFVDCCFTRKAPLCTAEVGRHSTIPGHLCNIAMRVKRKITWDAKTETIIGDAEASKWLSRPYRDGWKLA